MLYGNLFYVHCRTSVFDYTQDGGNNSNVEEEDTGYLEFAYLTGNTTCRADSSNTSCYSSIYFNDVYGLVTEAIVSCQLMNTLPSTLNGCITVI